MKTTMIAATFLAASAGGAFAAPETYTLDSSHSQIVFSYNHLGFSTGYGMFSGFSGNIMYDADAPANSTVSVSIPLKSMLTGWQERYDHFMSAEFFAATDNETITFTSTGIEVTGENTAIITGDLTLNEVTKSVALSAKLNQAGNHPMMNQPWLGFDATTTLLRTDYNLGLFEPFISNEVDVKISIEAMKAR